MTSVYDDPDYADIQQELKERFDELQEKYEDNTWADIRPGIPWNE